MGPKSNHCGTCQCIRHSILQWRSSLGTLHPELAYWDALLDWHKTLLLMQDALRPWKRRMGAAMRKNNNREVHHDHLHAAGLCTSDLACNYMCTGRRLCDWLCPAYLCITQSLNIPRTYSHIECTELSVHTLTEPSIHISTSTYMCCAVGCTESIQRARALLWNCSIDVWCMCTLLILI